jgi:hypothetical protein
MAGMHILGPPQPPDRGPPDRGTAGVYERPNRRPLWIAAAVVIFLLVAVLCALWWLT